MFKRLLHPSSAQSLPASAEELNTGLPTPPITERPRIDSAPSVNTTKLAAFDDIYRKSNFKSTTGEYNILKVADMAGSDQLHGLTPTAKHSALMMALEAAGVAVEDVLQDAMHRQRALEAYEEEQQKHLQEFERIKLGENERLTAEMDSISAQYRARIAAGVEDIERERSAFREWQERKLREQRRLAEAASLCVKDPAGISSEASVTRLLEKNVTYRQSA